MSALRQYRLARWPLLAAVIGGLTLGKAGPVEACPFCIARGPTLAQQIAAAELAVLAELAVQGPKQATFRPLRWLEDASAAKSAKRDEHDLALPVDLPERARGLFLLLGEPADEEPEAVKTEAPQSLRWRAVAVDEAGFAYLAGLPSARAAAAARLRYAARFLENAEPLVAADAYLEFGHAPYDEVRQVADALPAQKLRDWLVDPGVPAERKGFYALALGLARSPADRERNAALLKRQIAAPADDFRAGFDGVLAGYLLLRGEAGLAEIEERILANKKSRDGDVRHALAALRFYHDYGREIPAPRLAQALAPLLDRPEFAAAAIVDLARWQDWSPLERVAKHYGAARFDTPAVREAVVGYLLVCPEPAAKEALAELRTRDPQGVAAAEAGAARFGGVK